MEDILQIHSEMDKPAQSIHKQHVLFEFSPFIAWDDTDKRIQEAYLNLRQLTAGKSAKECHDLYLKHISNSPRNLEDLTFGLLVALLVEQDGQQSRYYRDIVTLSKDGLALFSQHLCHIIVERLSKLNDHAIKQTFWVTDQLVKAGIHSAETVCSNLIRQIASGDVSARNLMLIENLLDLLTDNRKWLVNSTTFMVPTVIYTLMRLIGDHMVPPHKALREREIAFVIGLIREKFLDCISIGRDFLRLLHYISRIPEFEKLSHDIYNDPKSLHPTFQSPMQILSSRTPRRLFQSRLTFEMERKISFLATQVKFGNQKRYQDWFHRQYLATPESLSLRCDLIRYICTIIHPTNEFLCSDIIPRWAIIGWLLTTCTSSFSAVNSRLALFFDWLVYDVKMDNIMNIEPAILVMTHSMRSHPNVTNGLLDFLCRMPTIFSPKLSENIKIGIKKSLQQIVEKRVVASLSPLFDNPKHDPVLKSLIKENFSEFCSPSTDNGVSTHPPAPIVNIEEEIQQQQQPLLQSQQEQPQLPQMKVIYPFMTVPEFDFKETISSFDEPLRFILEDLSVERNSETRCGLMDKLISVVFDNSEQSANASLLKDLGQCIAYLIVDDFTTRIFPASSQDNESLEESLCSPFFILCRCAFADNRSSWNSTPMSLLASISRFFEAACFLVLYFLRVDAVINDSKVAKNYIDFCNAAKRKLTKCLQVDLLMVLTYDSAMFCFLVPSVFGELATCGTFAVTSNIEVIHMLVSALDPNALQELICLCLTNTIKIVNKDEVIPIIEASLKWESWEQYCLWKLINAQAINMEKYISVIPKLDGKAHPEAMSCVILNLAKLQEPSEEVIKAIFDCEYKQHDQSISNILRHWTIKSNLALLGERISALFESGASSPPTKRKGSINNLQSNAKMKNFSGLTARDERILCHLEAVRKKVPKSKLLGHTDIIEMLSQMEELSTDEQKKRFAELYANNKNRSIVKETSKKQRRMDKD